MPLYQTDLEVKVGFEPTGVEICSHLPWTTRPLHLCLVAGPGIEPGTRAYETLEIPFLYPAIVSWWLSHLMPVACHV
jgi:hypothetical protein